MFPDLSDVGTNDVIDWTRIVAPSTQAGIAHDFVEHEDEDRRQALEQRTDHHEHPDRQRQEQRAAGADPAHPLPQGLRDPLAHEDPGERRRGTEDESAVATDLYFVAVSKSAG